MAEASLWRTDKEEDTLSSGNLSVLSSFGESFMDMVAKNACSWHAVSRVSGRGCANIINYNNAHHFKLIELSLFIEFKFPNITS